MEKDILAEAKDAFQEAVDYEQPNRSTAVDDARFVWLADQWPDDIRRKREREQRPCLTINKLPAFVRQVVNDSRQNKPSITVSPIDSDADPETADIMSGMIRHIERNSNADVAYDTAVEWAVVGGIGYIEVGLDYASDVGFEQEIKIKRIVSPFSVYGDPASECADSSDWKCAFQVLTGSEKEYAEKYGSKDIQSWTSEGLGDEENDSKRDVLRVVRYWKVEPQRQNLILLSNGGTIRDEQLTDDLMAVLQAAGVTPTERSREVVINKVRYYILADNAVLEEGEWAGRYIPLVPVYGSEFWIEGQRYWKSLVHDAIDSQRMFNYWRTVSTELVALAPKAPFIGPKGAFKTDAKKWNTANTENYPYLQYDGEVSPQRQGFTGPPAAALQEALNASDDLKAITGIYDPSLGARSNETSGRAILARQRESDTSTFHFIDNLTRAIRHVGRIVVDLIPKVYDTPRIIRVLGKDESAKLVTVNQDGEGIERIYDLTVGRYDVAVSAGPSYNTQRQESATQMIELLRAFPDAAPIIGDLVAKNLDWPGAEEIAKRLKTMLPPQIQQMEGDEETSPEVQAAMAQAQQAMQMVQQQAAQAQQLMSEAQTEKAEADKAKAEIKVMIAELKTQQAELRVAEAELKAQVTEAGAQMQQRETAVAAQAQQVASQGEQVDAASAVQQALSVVTERIAQLEGAMVAQAQAPKPTRKRVRVNRDQLGNLVDAEIEDIA